jgi:hypothetical protein
VAVRVSQIVDGAAPAEHQVQRRSALVAVLRAGGIFVRAEGTAERRHWGDPPYIETDLSFLARPRDFGMSQIDDNLLS